MSLKGNLNSVDLANIFQMLSINQKEGTLDIFDGETRKTIHISPQGVSILSRGDAEKDSLGRILLRFDQIGEDLLETARAQARESGRPLGVVLREGGSLPAEVIEDAERIQIEEEIQNLFIWKDLTFEFHEGISPEDASALSGSVARITFNVNSLIMEAARRNDEWEIIKGHVSSMAEIYRYTGRNMELSDEIFEEPWIDKVLGAIDGRRTVEEIIEKSYGNRFEVCKVLSLLLAQGAVEAVPPQDLSDEAEKALAEGHTAEAIKFLERLVELGGPAGTAKTLGQAYERSGEVAKAARCYLKHAESAIEAGAVAEGFDHCARACTLLPTDLAAGRRLLDVFHAHSDELAEKLPEVVARGKDLAACLFEIKDHERAVEVLKLLLEHAPEDFSIRNLLVNLYLSSGNAGAAVGEFLRMADWHTRKKDWEQVIRILRRVLSIDRSREDVYQRLEQLLAKKQRKRRGVRHIALFAILGLCLAFLAYAYVDYEIDARSTIAAEESRTGVAVSVLDKEIAGLTKDLEWIHTAVATTDPDVPRIVRIMKTATALRQRYAQQIDADMQALEQVAEKYRFSNARSQATQKQHDLRIARSRFESAVEAVRAAVQQRALEMAAAGEHNLSRGRPSEALDLYRKAFELAVDRQPFLEGSVDRIIESLTKDLAIINQRLKRLSDLCEAKEFGEARKEGLALVEEYWLAEVLDRMDLPVWVQSVPNGATIYVNGEASGQSTPAFVRWHPGREANLTFMKDGFLPATETLTAADNEVATRELPRLRKLEAITAVLRKEFLWQGSLSGAVEARAAICGERVVLATRNSTIYCVDTVSRRSTEIYRASGIGGIASTPAAADGRVFAATVDGELVALSLSGGAPLWSRKMPGRVYAPVVAGPSEVVVADVDGMVAAFDPESGEERWRAKLPGDARAGAAVADGAVFYVTQNNHVCVLSLSDGSVRFDVVPDVRAGRPIHGPAVLGDTVCVVSEDGVVIGLDAQTGAETFRVETEAEARLSPVVSGDAFLVTGRDGVLRAIREGRVADTLALTAPAQAMPTATGDFVLVPIEGGSAVAARLSARGFESLWKVELPSAPGGAPRTLSTAAVTGECALVATDSGEVYLLSK